MIEASCTTHKRMAIATAIILSTTHYQKVKKILALHGAHKHSSTIVSHQSHVTHVRRVKSSGVVKALHAMLVGLASIVDIVQGVFIQI